MKKNENKYPMIDISELIPYERNARTHSPEQIEAICNSLNEFGFINPVIIDENNMILVGHGRIEAAKVIGLTEAPYRRIEGLTDDQKRAYILADNKLSDLGGWNEELLNEELENISLDMTLFGFDEMELGEIDEDLVSDGDPYTKKVDIPHYEITGAEPKIEELYNQDKTNELIEEIEKADISEEQKAFLISAAQRHTVFNYKNIAEYYAHQGREVQELMERSALVIIDFENAIRGGYVAMANALDYVYKEDDDDDNAT